MEVMEAKNEYYKGVCAYAHKEKNKRIKNRQKTLNFRELCCTFVPKSMLTLRSSLFARLFTTLLLLGGVGQGRVWAQQDVAFAQYWRLGTQWNPALAGRTPQLSIHAALQSHALGYEDAGSTMWAGADMALQLANTRHGVGASFLNDRIGLFSHKRFALQYAYHYKMWGGQLSVGGEVDFLQEDIDGSKADFGTGADPAFPSSQVNGSGVDFAAGVHYERKNWQVALAAQHLAAPTIAMGDTHFYPVRRYFLLMGAYDLSLSSPHYWLTPSVMLRSDWSDHRLDFTLRGTYQYEGRRIVAGLGYAPARSVGAFVGGTLHGVDLCYSYEANTVGLGLAAGQHEVTVTYRMDLNLGKRGRNLHKSVRWL